MYPKQTMKTHKNILEVSFQQIEFRSIMKINITPETTTT